MKMSKKYIEDGIVTKELTMEQICTLSVLFMIIFTIIASIIF